MRWTGLHCLLGCCRGFTAFPRQDYAQWKKEGRLINDGVNAKVGGARKHPVRASMCTLAMCVLLLVVMFSIDEDYQRYKTTKDALCLDSRGCPSCTLPGLGNCVSIPAQAWDDIEAVWLYKGDWSLVRVYVQGLIVLSCACAAADKPWAPGCAPCGAPVPEAFQAAQGAPAPRER